MAINRLQIRRDSLANFQTTTNSPVVAEPTFILEEGRVRVAQAKGTIVGRQQIATPLVEGSQFHSLWNVRSYGNGTCVDVPTVNGYATNGEGALEPQYYVASGMLPKAALLDAGTIQLSASGDFMPGSTDPSMIFGFEIGQPDGTKTSIGPRFGPSPSVSDPGFTEGLEISAGTGFTNCLGDYNKPVIWELDAKVCLLGRDSISPFRTSTGQGAESFELREPLDYKEDLYRTEVIDSSATYDWDGTDTLTIDDAAGVDFSVFEPGDRVAYSFEDATKERAGRGAVVSATTTQIVITVAYEEIGREVGGAVSGVAVTVNGSVSIYDNANVRVVGTLTIQDPFSIWNNSASYIGSDLQGQSYGDVSGDPFKANPGSLPSNYGGGWARGAVQTRYGAAYEAMGLVPADRLTSIQALPGTTSSELNDKIDRLLNQMTLTGLTQPGQGRWAFRWWRPKRTVIHFSFEEYVSNYGDEDLQFSLKVGGPMQSDAAPTYPAFNTANNTIYPSAALRSKTQTSTAFGILPTRLDYDSGDANLQRLCFEKAAGEEYVCRTTHQRKTDGTAKYDTAPATNTLDADEVWYFWDYEDPATNPDGEWNCAWRRLAADRRDRMRIHHTTAYFFGGRPGATDYRPF